MADYMTLLGAEQVQSASRTVREAAELMQLASSEISGTPDRLQHVLDNFLIRFGEYVERIEAAINATR